jgi:hypothetical protein
VQGTTQARDGARATRGGLAIAIPITRLPRGLPRRCQDQSQSAR